MDSDEFQATVDETVVEWKRLVRHLTALMTGQIHDDVGEILANRALHDAVDK